MQLMHMMVYTPVLARARGVGRQVADDRGVRAARRVEADRRLDAPADEVAVDGRGHAHHARARAAREEVLREDL